MKVVLVADIHANLEALISVDKEIKKIKPEKVVCLGDIVGYGASPNECVEFVKEKGWGGVIGNHDYAVASDKELSFFNPFARKALLWTRGVLKEEYKSFLNDLPFLHKESLFLGVHASLDSPEQFNYLTSYSSILNDFQILKEKKVNLCFVAHTHIPGVYIYKNQSLYREHSSKVELKFKSNYIINVGSIGQPRDRNPLSCFCVFDSDNGTVEFFRKGYDIKTAQKKIKKAKLPSLLANRLAEGW